MAPICSPTRACYTTSNVFAECTPSIVQSIDTLDTCRGTDCFACGPKKSCAVLTKTVKPLCASTVSALMLEPTQLLSLALEKCSKNQL